MLSIQYNTQLGSHNAIKKFIQKENYEHYLCEILKKSSFFEEDLMIIENQEGGKDDYYSPKTGKTYEATLIIPESFIKDLKNGIEIWSSSSFRETLFKKSKSDVQRMLQKKIGKKKKDIVLFNIVPLRGAQIPAEIFYHSVVAPVNNPHHRWGLVQRDPIRVLLRGKIRSSYQVDFNPHICLRFLGF